MATNTVEKMEFIEAEIKKMTTQDRLDFLCLLKKGIPAFSSERTRPLVRNTTRCLKRRLAAEQRAK